MTPQDRSNLQAQFDAWLLEHMGKRKSDKLTESDLQTLRLLLGGSYGSVIQSFREGKRTAFALKQAIRELVEAGDPEDVMRLRRDQALARDLMQGLSMYKASGVAPNGGNLMSWAISVRRRLDKTFNTSAEPQGEAGTLWGQIAAPANIRRLRHAA